MSRPLTPFPQASLWVRATVVHAGLGALALVAAGCDRPSVQQQPPPADVTAPRADARIAARPDAPTMAADVVTDVGVDVTDDAHPDVVTDASVASGHATSASDAGSADAARHVRRVRHVTSPREQLSRQINRAPTCGPCCHGGGPGCRDFGSRPE